MRVLVIEDDVELAETVAAGLRRRQMAVDIAFDGPAGLDRALFTDYDVIVLDRDLPGLHGDRVCAEISAAGRRARVLMLAVGGGAAGVAAGALATAIYASARHWAIVIPPLAWAGGFGAALAIGAIAGLLPALRAARLSPTEALRTALTNRCGSVVGCASS